MSNSANFWNKRSAAYDASIQKHGPVFKKSVERAVKHLNANDFVMDLGCASGEHAREIAPHINQLIGIDPSEKMIELAKGKANSPDNLRFKVTDVFDTSFTPGSFNAVLAFNVIHLVEDPEATLSRIHDLLKPNGLVISQTPCLRERGWFTRFTLNTIQKTGLIPKIKNFNFEELELLFVTNGFEIHESEIWDKEDSEKWIIGKKLT